MSNVVNIFTFPKGLFGWWAHWFEAKLTYLPTLRGYLGGRLIGLRQRFDQSQYRFMEILGCLMDKE